MYALLKVSRGLGGFADMVGRLACWLFIPMMVVITYDITQRKILTWYPEFQSSSLYETFPSTKLQESEWHLHAFLFLLCLGYTYVRNGHVRVELIRERMKPRTRAWIELLGCLLFLLPYCAMVVYFAWGQLIFSYNINESSSATVGLPYRWIVKGGLVAGFLILAIAGISVLLKHVVYLFGPPELKAATGDFVEVSEIEHLKKDVAAELSHKKSGGEG